MTPITDPTKARIVISEHITKMGTTDIEGAFRRAEDTYKAYRAQRNTGRFDGEHYKARHASQYKLAARNGLLAFEYDCDGQYMTPTPLYTWLNAFFNGPSEVAPTWSTDSDWFTCYIASKLESGSL